MCAMRSPVTLVCMTVPLGQFAITAVPLRAGVFYE